MIEGLKSAEGMVELPDYSGSWSVYPSPTTLTSAAKLKVSGIRIGEEYEYRIYAIDRTSVVANAATRRLKFKGAYMRVVRVRA